MSALRTASPPLTHLKLLAAGLLVIVLCLLGFLFGVELEAVTRGEGVALARELQDLRARVSGQVEPGWFEAQTTLPDGTALSVRMDGQGDGLAVGAAGQAIHVVHHEVIAAGHPRIPRAAVRWHRLEAGDELWPGQVIASVQCDDWRFQLDMVENQLKFAESEPLAVSLERLRAERDWLRHQLSRAVLHVPASGERWLAVKVPVSPLQAVQPGDVVAAICPIDPQTRRPCDPIVRLDLEEDELAGVSAGQPVRLYSAVHSSRLHGCAEGRVERIEPWGDGEAGERRRFQVVVSVRCAPYDLPLGSSVMGEIRIGRKPVYRIILDH